MKKLIFLMLLSVGAYAQITIRVTTGQNLQTLIDANPAGTVYIVEGGIENTNLDIDKKVTIFGTGYFLNAIQATPGVSTVSHIRIKPGGDGTYISGLKCQSINITADNVTIQRNYCESNQPIRLGYTGLGSGGEWTGTTNNCMILQNYAARLEIINQNAPTSRSYNFIVKGNIFYINGFHLEGDISGEISNNTFNAINSSSQTYHSFNYSAIYQRSCKVMPVIFRNNIMPNILGGGDYYGSFCSITDYPTTDFRGNVFTQDFTNLVSSNTINADPTILFLGYLNNPNNLAPDARAQLSANSPAKGAGVGGTDAGAFGGDTPYVLSGIPSIPVIYSLETNTQVPQGGTLQVNIKAKTNN